MILTHSVSIIFSPIKNREDKGEITTKCSRSLFFSKSTECQFCSNRGEISTKCPKSHVHY